MPLLRKVFKVKKKMMYVVFLRSRYLHSCTFSMKRSYEMSLLTVLLQPVGVDTIASMHRTYLVKCNSNAEWVPSAPYQPRLWVKLIKNPILYAESTYL